MIPAEAVEAAMEAYYANGEEPFGAPMRAALEAAAPYIRAQALEDAADIVDDGAPAHGQDGYADWLRDRAAAERGGE